MLSDLTICHVWNSWLILDIVMIQRQINNVFVQQYLLLTKFCDFAEEENIDNPRYSQKGLDEHMEKIRVLLEMGLPFQDPIYNIYLDDCLMSS